MTSASAAVAQPPTPAPAPATSSAAPPPATRPDSAPARPTGRFAALDTPHQLRLLSTGLVLLGVVVGLVSALTFAYLAYALGRAEDDAAQLIRVQQIQTNLLSADATATNAFLVGGLEPAVQRAAYDEAMTSTSTLIAQAARAQPADAQALATLNTEVVAYAAAIEQARANNRQGLPVGAQYLRSASAELRSTALPILDNLVASNAGRATDGMKVRIGFLAVSIILAGLAGLIATQVFVARQFHRRINTGLLAASTVLLLALAATVAGMWQLTSSVSATRTGSFADLNNAASVRIQANDAKSNESLTLIARGSGGAFETAWKTSAEVVTTKLSYLTDQPGLTDQWRAYADVHAKIRTLDDGGSWDAAVGQATGANPESANATFTAFDSALAGYVDQVSAATANSLSSRQPALVIAAILSLLAGVAAAVLARRGIAERLKEYR